jgi:flagellar biosynthesis protein FlhG
VSDPPTPRDWELLGVTPEAGLEEVRSAYHRRRDLWDEGSLATYSLLDEDERVARVAEIEAAWQRVRASLQQVPLPAAVAADAAGTPDQGRALTPEAAVGPGALLRHHRLRSGLSLEEIAAITKIRPAILERLEREEFHLLPPRVYVRGFVIQVARTLGLEDVEGLAASFLARMG